MNAPVLITGVGKRVGLALAEHFLAQDVPVIGTFRTERDELDRLRERGAQLIACDFYHQAEVDAIIATLSNDVASLRAIIHNASDWLPESSGLPPAQLMDRMMRVHVSIPYQMNLALAPALRQFSERSATLADIIHISDYVADKGSKKHIAYAASKAALNNMTLSFAAQLAPHIKVNAIAPALLKFNEGDDASYQKKAVAKALLPWEGGFDELVRSVDYLMASRYITGRIQSLDGGRHLK